MTKLSIQERADRHRESSRKSVSKYLKTEKGKAKQKAWRESHQDVIRDASRKRGARESRKYRNSAACKTRLAALAEARSKLTEVPNKVCKKCGESKSLEMFQQLAANIDGRIGTCKVCKNAYNQALRKLPENAERLKLKSLRRYWKNPEEQRRRSRDAVAAKKILAYAVLGNKCTRCDWTDIRALQIDHINGDGYKYRQRSPTTGKKLCPGLGNIYTQIIEGSSDYQILCANCNWIKRVENGETKKRMD